MRLPTQSRKLKRSCCINGFAILLFFMSSCTNLGHIKQFAQTSTETATFNQLVDDYVRYSDRVIRYQSKSQKEHFEKEKQQRENQKAGLIALHQTMTNYMTALGALAEDKVVTYDAELDSLAKTLENSKFVKAESVQASGSISKILFKAYTGHWRKDKLKETIVSSNSDFQKLTKGLKFIVEEGFMNSLNIEMTSADKAFQKGMVDFKHRTEEKQTPPAIALLLEEWKYKKQNSIETKKKMIAHYAKVLDKVSEGHQNLYDNRDDLSRKELIEELKKHGKDLKKIYKSIKSL